VTAARVLVICPTLAVGGAERQISFLAPGLKSRGFDVEVATLKERGRFFDEIGEAGVETTHLGLRSRTDLRGSLRAYRLWRRHPDVVLTQGLDSHVLGHAVARRARAAHVAIEQGGPGLPRSRERRALLRVVAPRVDAVVAVSSSQEPELRRLGYRAEAIHVIPNASHEPVPSRAPGVVREELGLGEDDVVVLLPAALRPEKRADVFVDALALARRRDARVRGVVAGGGPLLRDIRERARSADGAVLVLGERSDIADLMSAVDVVCLSSDVEGIPLAALEAMALGRPLVATAVGGLRELVVPGRTGLLVPRDDPGALSRAVLELAHDPALRSRLGDEGRDRFRRGYHADQMIERYGDLLARIVTIRDPNRR
jgi:glycosyltransferase involved in cell wall biosynthesis